MPDYKKHGIGLLNKSSVWLRRYRVHENGEQGPRTIWVMAVSLEMAIKEALKLGFENPEVSLA